MIFNDIVELKCVSQSTHSLRTFEYCFSFEQHPQRDGGTFYGRSW